MRTAKDNLWLDEPYSAGPSLQEDQEADVAVIGGGLTGMASAYFIKKCFPEKRIIILESEFIGFGSSGRNGGVVACMLGNSVLPLKKQLGTENTILLQDLAHRSITLFRELIDEYGIQCDYEQCGRLGRNRHEHQGREGLGPRLSGLI